jgi:hypothetical protein
MTSVGEEKKAEMMRITGFPYGTIPFRYLGIPIAAERLYFLNLVEGIKTSVGLGAK